MWWAHSTEKVDWSVEYKDFSDGFRADLGFVPQVGFREGFVDGGYTFRPRGFFSRVGTFLFADKLNWQSVVLLGYGDTRTLSEEEGLSPAGRQLTLKVSYAFQM